MTRFSNNLNQLGMLEDLHHDKRNYISIAGSCFFITPYLNNGCACPYTTYRCHF